MKDRCIVVVADAGVIHHVLQIADHFGGAKIGAARRDQRLVHVQGNGKRAIDASKIYMAIGQKDRAPGAEN